MTIETPTPDDLRTIAANLRAEKHTSRADVLDNAVNLIRVQQETIKELESIANDAMQLGMSQANEYDRFWDALGVKSADITIDDAIAQVKRLRAVEAAARDVAGGVYGMMDARGRVYVGKREYDALAAALQGKA